MANLVPKVNNVGKLGTSSKLWNEVHQTTSLFGTASITEESNVLKVKDAPLTVEQNLTVGQSLAITAQASSLDLNSQKIINLATPTSNGDAASKAYVDSVAQGLDVKDSVRVATTAALTLASELENGDTVDGVVLATGDRVLVKDQASASENGIYVVAASGAPARSADFAASSNAAGTFVFVEEGTANADAGFVCTSNSGSDVVGTNTLAFSQFSGAGAVVAGDGLDKTGNTLSVNVDDSSLEIDTDTLRIKAAGVTSSMLSSSAVDNTNLAAASITGQTVAQDAIADDDLVLIYDTSASALRKMTKANFVSGLSGGAAADDITVGDAAVTLATTAGNITLDAQGNDTDIIFKGTDGGSDITMLTLDGSAAGKAIFNDGAEFSNDVRLKKDGAYLYFGADSDVRLKHVTDTGLELSMPGSVTGNYEPRFTITTENGDSNSLGPTLRIQNYSTGAGYAGTLEFYGENDAGFVHPYAYIRTQLADTTAGAEEGNLQFYVQGGGSGGNMEGLRIEGTTEGCVTNISRHNGTDEGLMLASTLVTSTAAELNALDVSSESPSDNEVLTYTAGNGLHWAAVSGGGGSAPTVTAASPSSAYTISTYSGIEEVYLLNPSTSITVNLPSAATAGSGYKYQIKNLSTNTLTLDPSSTETIDASTTVDISTQYSSLTIVSDGTNWFII